MHRVLPRALRIMALHEIRNLAQQQRILRSFRAAVSSLYNRLLLLYLPKSTRGAEWIQVVTCECAETRKTPKKCRELAHPDPANVTMLAWSASEGGLEHPHRAWF